MRISSVLVAPGVAQNDTCRCLEFKLNASRTRGCSCISTRADCMHRVHGLSIYVHPCRCRRHRHRSRRRRRLRSRGCKPRLLAFFLVFLSFFFVFLRGSLCHFVRCRCGARSMMAFARGFSPYLVLVHASRHNGWRLRITFARRSAEAGVSACARR